MQRVPAGRAQPGGQLRVRGGHGTSGVGVERGEADQAGQTAPRVSGCEPVRASLQADSGVQLKHAATSAASKPAIPAPRHARVVRWVLLLRAAARLTARMVRHRRRRPQLPARGKAPVRRWAELVSEAERTAVHAGATIWSPPDVTRDGAHDYQGQLPGVYTAPAVTPSRPGAASPLTRSAAPRSDRRPLPAPRS